MLQVNCNVWSASIFSLKQFKWKCFTIKKLHARKLHGPLPGIMFSLYTEPEGEVTRENSSSSIDFRLWSIKPLSQAKVAMARNLAIAKLWCTFNLDVSIKTIHNVYNLYTNSGPVYDFETPFWSPLSDFPSILMQKLVGQVSRQKLTFEFWNLLTGSPNEQ